jgi:hypothetical protein
MTRATRLGPPLKVLVAPLPEAQHAGPGGSGGAMILIDEPERNAAPAIAAEFGLSPQTIRTG